jgi:hypothetical protein
MLVGIQSLMNGPNSPYVLVQEIVMKHFSVITELGKTSKPLPVIISELGR